MSRFMAAIYDRFMRGMEEASGAAWRDELLADVGGTVVEIGAGTGRNLDHYGSRVERLVLAEPDPHMRKRLVAKLAGAPLARRAVVRDDPAEHLALGDARADVAVATLVLCSVPDVDAALAEVRRVLRPDGRLVFLEHVASDEPGRRAWQRRLEPAWRVVAGNCHLCRDTASLIEAAGFTFERLTRESARKALPIVRATIRGVAVKAPS